MQFTGLDYLETAVFVLNKTDAIIYANSAAEHLFSITRKDWLSQTLEMLFPHSPSLQNAIAKSKEHHVSYTEHDCHIQRILSPLLHLSVTISPIENAVGLSMIVEFRPIDQQLKIANAERMHAQQQANKELIRNLAHEIKNPLGGISGAAQLLEHELPDPALREYTQVIRAEAERLQALLDRLLTPSKLPVVALLNIHEVLERVRSITLAEKPQGLHIHRDYDASLPSLYGDKEQLIQVVLNIVRNAMQAIGQNTGNITLKTRIARQVTLNRKRHALAIQVDIIDDGPGIPHALQDKVFYPLVSGRADGHGVGLTLAQTFVQQHQGQISFTSQLGKTCFSLLLPLKQNKVSVS